MKTKRLLCAWCAVLVVCGMFGGMAQGAAMDGDTADATRPVGETVLDTRISDGDALGGWRSNRVEWSQALTLGDTAYILTYNLKLLAWSPGDKRARLYLDLKNITFMDGEVERTLKPIAVFGFEGKLMALSAWDGALWDLSGPVPTPTPLFIKLPGIDGVRMMPDEAYEAWNLEYDLGPLTFAPWNIVDVGDGTLALFVGEYSGEATAQWEQRLWHANPRTGGYSVLPIQDVAAIAAYTPGKLLVKQNENSRALLLKNADTFVVDAATGAVEGGITRFSGWNNKLFYDAQRGNICFVEDGKLMGIAGAQEEAEPLAYLALGDYGVLWGLLSSGYALLSRDGVLYTRSLVASDKPGQVLRVYDPDYYWQYENVYMDFQVAHHDIALELSHYLPETTAEDASAKLREAVMKPQFETPDVLMLSDADHLEMMISRYGAKLEGSEAISAAIAGMFAKVSGAVTGRGSPRALPIGLTVDTWRYDAALPEALGDAPGTIAELLDMIARWEGGVKEGFGERPLLEESLYTKQALLRFAVAAQVLAAGREPVMDTPELREVLTKLKALSIPALTPEGDEYYYGSRANDTEEYQKYLADPDYKRPMLASGMDIMGVPTTEDEMVLMEQPRLAGEGGERLSARLTAAAVNLYTDQMADALLLMEHILGSRSEKSKALLSPSKLRPVKLTGWELDELNLSDYLRDIAKADPKPAADAPAKGNTFRVGQQAVAANLREYWQLSAKDVEFYSARVDGLSFGDSMDNAISQEDGAKLRELLRGYLSGEMSAQEDERLLKELGNLFGPKGAAA